MHERRLRRPLARDFARTLTGRRIEQVSRRAKYLLLDLDDGASWLVHLGMTGTLVVLPADEPRRVHTHVVAALDDGRTLRFHDPRRFGLMRVGPVDRLAELAALGPEPLAADVLGRFPARDGAPPAACREEPAHGPAGGRRASATST